ncbi:MAG: phosphodiester glycosidase family protein [Gemmatimonadaceae bacterium]
MTRCAALVAALWLVLFAGPPAEAQDAPLPRSVLAFRDAKGAWRELWTSSTAPIAWSGAPLAGFVRWRAGSSGMEWGELVLRGTGEAWRTRLVVARVDPARVRFQLDTAFTAQREAAWSLARAPKGAVLAVNAGQFEATMPWGWVALDGRRWLPAQHGPLSAALAIDSSGALRWIYGDDVSRVAAAGSARWAFQSYPAVIAHDSILAPLRASGRGVDVAHRDARAGICITRDDRLVVAITRFDGVGSALDFVPFGLTAPEMAGVLGALGCRDAMLLDGGISARLRVRDARGVAHDWEGLRPVPLALVAFPR